MSEVARKEAAAIVEKEARISGSHYPFWTMTRRRQLKHISRQKNQVSQKFSSIGISIL